MTAQHKRKVKVPKRASYKHVFVDAMPDKLDEGVLYVCVQYATAAHNCFCGCGHEVVTPIHPTKWKLSFNGVNVSLYPSIGSWSLPCKSHYWLQDGQIMWAESWADDKIQMARAHDNAAQDSYYGRRDEATTLTKNTKKTSFSWKKMTDWFQEK